MSISKSCPVLRPDPSSLVDFGGRSDFQLTPPDYILNSRVIRRREPNPSTLIQCKKLDIPF